MNLLRLWALVCGDLMAEGGGETKPGRVKSKGWRQQQRGLGVGTFQALACLLRV